MSTFHVYQSAELHVPPVSTSTCTSQQCSTCLQCQPPRAPVSRFHVHPVSNFHVHQPAGPTCIRSWSLAGPSHQRHLHVPVLSSTPSPRACPVINTDPTCHNVSLPLHPPPHLPRLLGEQNCRLLGGVRCKSVPQRCQRTHSRHQR